MSPIPQKASDKKYGARATIFVNPEFVDNATTPRPTSEDVPSGKFSSASLAAAGFLSWAEMRIMEQSGLVDIQSHALTHTWYFSGPKVVDFHHPGASAYPWLAWNEFPERKPYYMAEDQSLFVHWGAPVYEHAKALICRRYFPPAEVVEGLRTYVAENGGADFFTSQEWRKQMDAQHRLLMERHSKDGRWESDDDYNQRVSHELKTSKEQIEKHLDKQVDFICWPGGGYNQTVLRLAREAGYRAWTLASRDQSQFRNGFGVGGEQVKRMGSFSRYHLPEGRDLGYADSRYFLCAIERHKGSFFNKWSGRVLLAAKQLCHLTGLNV